MATADWIEMYDSLEAPSCGRTRSFDSKCRAALAQSGLEDLRSFEYCGDSEGCWDELAEFLGRQPLTRLALSLCPIRRPSLDGFRELRHVEMIAIEWTGRSLVQHFGYLPSLKTLRCNSWERSEGLFDRDYGNSRRCFLSLEVLSLYEMSLSMAELEGLTSVLFDTSSFPNLKEFVFLSNPIRDEDYGFGVGNEDRDRRIEYFILQRTDTWGSFCRALFGGKGERLLNLERINLEENGLEFHNLDADLEGGSLPALKCLDIGDDFSYSLKDIAKLLLDDPTTLPSLKRISYTPPYSMKPEEKAKLRDLFRQRGIETS